MYYSLFEIFAVGIGPSSSHTVGPMRAAERFIRNLREKNLLNKVNRLHTTLYGSLALTGVGHGTLNAVTYGFMGLNAAEMDPETDYLAPVKEKNELHLSGGHKIDFSLENDIELAKNVTLKEHSNGLTFKALDKQNNVLLEETYFSVGGGTIARQDEVNLRIDRKPYDVPYKFDTCQELMHLCAQNKMSIAELVLQNEKAIRPREFSVSQNILRLHQMMQQSIDIGLSKDGYLPGGLKVKRHAKEMYERLKNKFDNNISCNECANSNRWNRVDSVDICWINEVVEKIKYQNVAKIHSI